MHLDAERTDTAQKQPRTRAVELPRHQARRELHDVRLEAHLVHRLGGFETEQAAAHHDRALAPLRVVADADQILDRAVNEDARFIDARDRRHERHRARAQDGDVVRHPLAARRLNQLAAPIEHGRALAEQQANATLPVPLRAGEQHLVGARFLEEAREPHAVVRRTRLLAERDHLVAPRRVELRDALAELPADHAVADDDELLLAAAAPGKPHRHAIFGARRAVHDGRFADAEHAH